jgi:drug/metabolite transporter (DMT)-like permease
MIVVCWSAAIVFPVLSLLGGTMQPLTMMWQPAVVGGLFLAGQLLTLLAVARGDVSVAAPILGVKVLFVPAASRFFVNEELSPRIWIAAAIAMVGIAFVQTRDVTVQRSKIVASVGFALLAACAMTTFDLLIQLWAPVWGAGYFLPIAIGFAAFYSLAFVGLGDRPADLSRQGAIGLLAVGGLFMAAQAIGMTLTLGVFGDATRVNIVYSLRGLWGVVLSWIVARQVITSGPSTSHRTMAMRLIGATLIGISVVISLTR